VRKRWRTRFGRRRAALVGAFTAAFFVISPPAQAGLLDFLFGGLQQRPIPPADVNSYAEPVAPPPLPSPGGAESIHASGGPGRAVTFCVRLCDGQHFPVEHLPNATPVETCRAMCPASKTKVFFGGEIDRAVTRDGARYADLDTAFVYRTRLVPNCTCNGKDAFGLAPFDLSSDPTLRPGDLVATKAGFVAYAGKRGDADAFTPVDTVAVEAELSHRSAPVRLSRQTKELGKEPAVVTEEPGIIVPRDVDQATR
jgi:Protein of unknown function (DUF2865)